VWSVPAGVVPAFGLPSGLMKRVFILTGDMLWPLAVAEVCVVRGKGRRAFTPHVEVRFRPEHPKPAIP
jgi:hypothetical protein